MKPRILSVNSIKPGYEAALKAYGAEPVCCMYPEISTDYDGLLLCGGVDMHPSHYGQENTGCDKIDTVRDENDLALAKAFIAAGKPILGICRGHQILNVIFGGTLIQHLSTTEDHKAPGDQIHNVTAVGETYLSRAYGEHFAVNSFHHQAVDKLGEGLRATLTCDSDGIVEAFEHETLPIIGVQWHPERMTLDFAREDTVDGKVVFEYFIDLCRKQK